MPQKMHAAPQAIANARCARSVADALALGCTPTAPRHVFVSPGSRSTPLVLAFDAHPNVQLHVILDERAAAFAALGHAQASGRAACTLCTSGSAAAHALPAAIEAFHAGIALLVLTADRPLESQGIGAPQTTWQPSLYSDHTRAHYNLPAPVAFVGPDEVPGVPDHVWGHWRNVLARALAACEGATPGPVHVNLPFREPLGTTPLPHDDTERPAPTVVVGADAGAPSEEGVQALSSFVARASRGAIVCGPAAPAPSAQAPYADALWRLAQQTGWPVFSEASANIGRAPQGVTHIVAADAIALSTKDPWSLPRADAWLHVGLAPAGRGLSRLVTDAQATHATVCAPEFLADPAHQSTLVCEGDVSGWLSALWARTSPASESQRRFAAAWRTHNDAAMAVLRRAHSHQQAWFEGTALYAMGAQDRAAGMLVVGNSLSVRDLDTFAVPAITGTQATVTLARRGVSGIEGALAHTLGVAMAAAPGEVIGIFGDLTFLHDVQSLRLLAHAQRSVRLLVFDNGGGEIFAQLPISSNAHAFNRYFQTPQHIDARGLCESQGAVFQPVDSYAALTAIMCAPLPTDGVQVVWLSFGPAARQARQTLLAQLAAR